MKKPLIVIAGPTASGKTSISIKLAKKINGEIISADSMQVYKYMDIGTAKATKEEMSGIKHYLIDELLPDEKFNVMIFQKMAKEYIKKIYDQNKIPIIVGGTGFYINSLVYNNNFMETNEADENIRKDLYGLFEKNGAVYLHNELKKVDPVSADKIHSNNVKRVIRALEYFKLTNMPISLHNEEEKLKESPYNNGFIILNMSREVLYERINKRVELMIENGLVNEVKSLLNMGYSKELVSMQGLGYKEIIPYLDGVCSINDAVTELKKRTRHFAKRQLTWFKGQNDGFWINITNLSEEETENKIIDYLKQLEIV